MVTNYYTLLDKLHWMHDKHGRTTKQIIDAPNGAIYIWVNDVIAYPRMLADKLGRTDLKFAGPTFLSSARWRGHDCSIILDHACKLNEEQQKDYAFYQARNKNAWEPPLTTVEDPNQKLKDLLDQAFP